MITIRRSAAIGDVISSTVVADKLIALGLDVCFQSHNMIHCVLRRHGRLARIEEPLAQPQVNLDGAYERDAGRRRKHFNQMWIEKANEQLMRFNIGLGPATNCKPHLKVSFSDTEAVRAQWEQYERPWILVCPRSDSYNVRQVPDGIWQEAASKMVGTKFWLGRHPAPKNFVDLNCQHLDMVFSYVSAADLFVTVDTGPAHIAAALGIPMIAISQSSSPELHFSDQADFEMISQGLKCENCQQNVCPINQHIPPCQNMPPELISQSVNRKLQHLMTDGVSAVIAIYKPEVETLNRCLSCVLPQVDEVILAMEGLSVMPAGVIQDSRIRAVRKHQNSIGYGRNCNHGGRHSSHRNLLLMNDDVFLLPDAVEKMKQCLGPDVGAVTPLLRYPDGLIYHCGKRRMTGQRAFGHIDHRQKVCTLKGPTYMENVCFATALMRRKVFYDLDGWDEDYFIYSEDDDLSLRIRRSGLKLVSQPSAEGIHQEHSSTRKLGDIMGAVEQANKIFHRKWGGYYDHNLNNPDFGNFDYCSA
jgi:GT2 family glycosyltransferase